MASALERLRKARQGSETSLASANIKGTSGTSASSSGSALARLRAAQSKPTLTSAAQIYASDEEKKRREEEKNRGGLIGGAGYLTEKLTLGTVQGIEGVVDFLVGGAADLFGADDFAERQFANDWFNYSHADEWYNPGEGWKVAGDVAGGIGSSIPTIATAAAVTLYTGGAGAGIAATLVAGTSAGGTAVKEAYQETGKLTGKEWGYGALSGATEGLIEYATAGLGAGAGAIGKRIGQAFGKTAAKEVGKTTVKSVAVDLGKNFLSEAFEEGFSELMSPQYKKLTYDPSAKNATAGEIGYAALVGGLSGLITSGAGTTVTQVGNIRKGAKAEASGSIGRIKAISEVVLEASGDNTDVQSVNAVRDLYHDLTEGKLKITEGEKLTVPQKRALGELQNANMAAIFEPKMAQAAGNAVKNAEAVAERLNSYGNIKIDENGKLVVTGEDTSSTASGPPSPTGEGLRDITAEDIRAKFDTKNGKQALAKAIQDNEVLRYVAASDVAGRLIMSVEQFEKTALEGTNIKNQVDLNKFIEEASPEKRAALGSELGIADNEWDTLQLGRLNEAVRSYRESGKADTYKSRVEAVNKAKSVDESAAKKKIPSVIRLGDSKVERYKTDKVDIAVYREGDSFTVYDYNEGTPSRALSRAEVNSVLEQMRNGEGAVVAENGPASSTVPTGENTELTNINRENMQVSAENSLSPSARMAKETVDTSSTADAVPLPPLGKAKNESSSVKAANEKVATLKERIDAEKIDAELRESVADYDSLKEADRSMVRKVVREGRVHGLSEADILSYARVAAHTGINIEYDANMKDGDAGYYDPKANKIVVNPKAEKKQELILIHELDHAVRKLVDLGGNVHTLVYEGAEKGLSKETWEQIKADYAEQDVDVTREELLADEASAYYTEAILGGKVTVDMLLGYTSSTASGPPVSPAGSVTLEGKQHSVASNDSSAATLPTGEGLAKKILNFFTSAARAYSKDEKLSRAARRHYKSFKAMFDAFAKANQGRNAETAVEVVKTTKNTIRFAKMSADGLSDSVDRVMKMDDDEAIKNKEEGNYISISKSTPGFILEKVGDAEDLELIMRFDSFYLATRHSGALKGHYHNYGDIMKSLPEIISNPLAIVRMDDGRLNILSEVKTAKGNTSIVSVELNTVKDINGKNDKYNLVVTITPAKDNYVRNNLQNRGIKVEYEKEDLSQVNSQLHEWLTTINDKSSDTSITDSAEKSNSFDKKTSENERSRRNSTSIEVKLDSDYLAAVEKGDMKTAQRMVDEAAKKAGYTVKAYHGTPIKGITVFDNAKIGSTTDDGIFGRGFYFTTNKLTADGYATPAGATMPVFLKVKKAWWGLGHKIEDVARELDLSESVLTTRKVGKRSSVVAPLQNYSQLFTSHLVERGYDSVIVQHGTGDYEIVTFKNADIKSADPVTYDDNGDIIPLSERFNSENSDIRYAKDIKPELADEVVTETEENVGKSRFEEPDIKLNDKITAKFTTAKDKVYIDTVDETHGIEKYLTKFGKQKHADAFIQQVRSAETIAQTMIGVSQYDIVAMDGKRLGDGVQKIFKKYKLRKIDTKFNTYLLHQLNVDRMTLEERSLAKQEELLKEFEKAEAAYHRAKRLVDEGKRKTVPKDIWNGYRKAKSAYENYEVLKNKPVFGANEKRAADITAEESRAIIAEYEKRYPEFKESAEEVWAYSRNLQKMRVEAGLLSQESADIMAEYYPHYVPSFRDKKGGVGLGTVKNDSQLAVNSTVKKAVGGGEDIYDIEESIAIQTRQTIKAIKMNQLANAVYDSAVASGDTTYVLTAEAAEQVKNSDPDTDIDIDIKPKNNQIVFYKDGKKVAMNVSEEIFKGFKGVTEGSVPDSPLLKLTSKVLGGFKNLVTQYSPAFAARNFIRDMQDAIINTKHPGKFATHVKAALMGMVNNDSDWQNYLAYGGFASTVFDAKGFQNEVDARGFEELKKISGIDAKDFKSMAIPLQNLLKFIGNANSFIEQLTRFTEYKASIAAGDSIEVAINNSAEVTTNFSRHGATVKKLNATVIPFLNASVQGFDKMLRVISGPFKEKSLTALAILLAKIVAIGITPQILNMIMNGDDEDYNDLTDEVKSNYFLIKVGDQFIKIPRGRLAGAFGGFVNQMRNVSRGEGFDAAGYTESIVANLTPVDSFSRDIFSPFRDVATNTTWYGGEIEGRQFDNVRPSQRYDESTSSIAIALGQAFNYSPKKIHYLLDQYSGVIGDFVLPATTKKAEKDYLSANFLLDPKTNNKLSDQFYKLYDEAQYAKNEGDVTAYYQLKHLNDVKDSVSELYDQITEIQRSDLSNTEKLQQTRVIRTLINNLYKTAKADYGAYTQAIEATAGVFDDSDASQQKLRHTVITQMMYGSEAALEQYNSDVYEKATLANKAGISYDLYYEYYFATRDITSDYDKKGEVIAGSKKEKTLKAIKALGVSANERLLLMALSGYSLTDAEKRRLLSIITRMNGTKEEKAALAEKCGFKVKNGRISLK